MRLKEDTTNWRASSLLKRDFKHDHSEGAVVRHSYKITRKWCRGKVDVAHDIEWRKETWPFGKAMYIGTCTACGKRFYRAQGHGVQ